MLSSLVVTPQDRCCIMLGRGDGDNRELAPENAIRHPIFNALSYTELHRFGAALRQLSQAASQPLGE